MFPLKERALSPLRPFPLGSCLIIKNKKYLLPLNKLGRTLAASASGSRLQRRRRCLTCNCALMCVHPPIYRIHTYTHIYRYILYIYLRMGIYRHSYARIMQETHTL